MEISVYPPELQGRGAFDEGRITEIKPIGFPGEGSAVSRIGPLFYWAWASSTGAGRIGLHPHRGFEIVSYVLAGEIGHRDTLGTTSRVGAGGAQIMQAGSGLSHEEEILGTHTEFFQIWFEPHLREAVQREPVYAEYSRQQLEVSTEDGVQRVAVIGNGSPIRLSADARLEDVTIDAGRWYRRTVDAGRSLAAVVISGEGRCLGGSDERSGRPLRAKDFLVARATAADAARFEAGTNGMRLAIVDVPTAVTYPLYPKR